MLDGLSRIITRNLNKIHMIRTLDKNLNSPLVAYMKRMSPINRHIVLRKPGFVLTKQFDAIPPIVSYYGRLSIKLLC